MILTFLLLTLAIALLWLPGRQRYLWANYAWLLAFLLSLSVALYTGQLTWVGLLPILLLGLVCFAFPRLTRYWRMSAGLVIVGLSVGLGLHRFPGFQSLVIVEQVQLAADSLTYSLRFHLDKAIIGLLILAFLHPLLTQSKDIMPMLRRWFPVAVVTMSVVVLASIALGYVRVDVKLPDFLFYWFWANLVFTCVAEEALFRGFIQRQLAGALGHVRYGAILALVVSAILFGVAHAAGGITYVLLATLAGLGYGWVYHRTQRIEASILLHIVLNSMHILFFSYPALR